MASKCFCVTFRAEAERRPNPGRAECCFRCRHVSFPTNWLGWWALCKDLGHRGDLDFFMRNYFCRHSSTRHSFVAKDGAKMAAKMFAKLVAKPVAKPVLER